MDFEDPGLAVRSLATPGCGTADERGIREEATEPVKYEIWLSPDRKLTAEVLPSAGNDAAADLVVDGAIDVVRMTPAAR